MTEQSPYDFLLFSVQETLDNDAKYTHDITQKIMQMARMRKTVTAETVEAAIESLIGMADRMADNPAAIAQRQAAQEEIARVSAEYEKDAFALRRRGGRGRRHLATCRTGAHRCYNDNCVRKSKRTYKTTTGRKCRKGSHKCRDNRCHKLRIVRSRRIH